MSEQPDGAGHHSAPDPLAEHRSGADDDLSSTPPPLADSVQPPPREAMAGFWMRLLGMVIDEVTLAFVTGVVWGVLPLVTSTGRTGFLVASFVLRGAYFTYCHGSEAGQSIGNRLAHVPPGQSIASARRWWMVPFVVLGWVFRAAGALASGRPTGMRVVDADTGGSLSYLRAFARYVVSFSYIPGMPTIIVFGYLWMLVDPRRQTLHDKAANSVVVKADAPVGGPAPSPAT